MRQFWEFRSYTLLSHLSLGPYSQNDPVRGPYQCWPGMSRLSTRAYTRVWVALTYGQFGVKRTHDTLPRQAFLFPHPSPPPIPLPSQACVLQSLQNAPMGWASHDDANLCKALGFRKFEC
jgi:hypothetical protein